MSGRFMTLRPGEYLLRVKDGAGPAGIHRLTGRHVHLDRDGGEVTFRVPSRERVYLWWRGPAEPVGVEVVEPRAPFEGRAMS